MEAFIKNIVKNASKVQQKNVSLFITKYRSKSIILKVNNKIV